MYKHYYSKNSLFTLKRYLRAIFMQVFEVFELREFPYFISVDVEEEGSVRDILTEMNSSKVYLLVDDDTKRIWTYNGPFSPFKLQIYGGILAGMLRKQLRLFYHVFPLNQYAKKNELFQEILDKPLGPGRARSIGKEDFTEKDFNNPEVSAILHVPRLKDAMKKINDIPKPELFRRIFITVGGIIYSEEEITESILGEEKKSINTVKMGSLNDGFTFFDDRNYSTRIVVKDRAIQGIELYVHKYDKTPSLRIKAPIIEEEKIHNKGDVANLISAFKIPDSLPPIESTEKDNQN